MSGKKFRKASAKLRRILTEEFLEKTAVWGNEEAERAVRALESYDDAECFLKETG